MLRRVCPCCYRAIARGEERRCAACCAPMHEYCASIDFDDNELCTGCVAELTAAADHVQPAPRHTSA